MKQSMLLLSVFKQFCFLVLALLVLTLFINLSWFDEELHPLVQLNKTPKPVALENNGYPLVWGLESAAEKEPFEVGKAVIDKQRQLYSEGKKIEITPEQLQELYGTTDLHKNWQEQFFSPVCVSRLTFDCVPLLVEKVKSLGVSEPALQLAMARYQQILKQESFQENQEGDMFSPLPPYQFLMNTNRVYLTFKAQNETPQTFLSLLEKDWQFWLTMLRDSDYLISKMVALAGIRHDQQLVSYLVRERYFNHSELLQLQNVIRQLSEQERNISETFDAELRLHLISLRTSEESYGSPLLSKLFWQENATDNYTYLHIFAPVQLLASLSPNEFYERRGFEKQNLSVRTFPPDLYNIGGKLAVKNSLGIFNLQDYVSRVNDTVGLVSALKLQIEIALNPETDFQKIIDESQYRNPYTLEPFSYRIEDKSVGFDCLSPGQTHICRALLN